MFLMTRGLYLPAEYIIIEVYGLNARSKKSFSGYTAEEFWEDIEPSLVESQGIQDHGFENH